MKKFSFLTVLVLLFPIALAFASPLTIEDAFASAKANSSSWLLTLEQYQDSVQLTNDQNPFIPSLSLSASLSVPYSFINYDTWNGLNYSLGLSSSLSLDPSIYTLSQTKALNNESSYLSLLSAESTLKSNVVTAYLNVVLYRTALSVSESALETAIGNLNSTSESYEAGLVDYLTLLSVQNSVSSAKMEVRNNENSLSAAERSFKVLTGLDVNEIELVSYEEISFLDLPDGAELFDSYKYNNLSVQSAQNAAASSELSYKSTKNGYTIPTVSLGVSYSLGDNKATTSLSNFSDSLTGSISVSLPFSGYFKGSTANTTIKSAKNSASYAKQQVYITMEEVENSVISSVDSLNVLEEQILMLEQNLESSKTELELSYLKWESGYMSYDSYMSVSNTVKSTEYSLLSAKINYVNALYSLASLLGCDYQSLNELYIKEN